MAQYVSVIIPFGNKVFSGILNDVVKRDRTLPIAKGIGAPAAFVFTSKGDVVYAGPNRANGLQPDEEFKEIILSGIESNGSASSATEEVAELDMAEEVAEPATRTWTSKNGNFTVEAELVSQDATTVRLKKLDGKVIEVPVSALSDEDRKHLESMSPE
jgi:nitrogenase subunit NifH